MDGRELSRLKNGSGMVKDEYIDVLGIGNALIDILVRSDDLLLHELGITKESMAIISRKRAEELYEYFRLKRDASNIYEIKDMSGGAAANVVAGIASFGGKAAYIGKVDDDTLGERFIEKLKERGIYFDTQSCHSTVGTGRSFIIITTDGKRSMFTYLGVAGNISEDDIDPELVAKAKIVYLTGFLLDCLAAKAAIFKSIDIARSCGNKIAFSLSNFACVQRHQPEFKKLISEHVDIIFANEQEVGTLFDTSDIANSAKKMQELIADTDKIAVLTCGSKGAKVIHNNEIVHHATEPVVGIVDSTGVGSLFASGFLYGYNQGLSLEDCCKLANQAAAQGLRNLGARPLMSLDRLLKDFDITVS